jgi:hypothetical protein
MARYDDTRNPLSPNYRPPPPPELRKPGQFEELAGAVLAALFSGLFSIAIIGFFLLLFYGVVLLIFRHAFGVELPNPFTWFGMGWFGK